MAKKLWERVRQQIEAGNPPPVFVTRIGRLALDGSAAELPQAIADLYPEEIIKAAHTKASEAKARADAEMEQRKERDAARQTVISEFRSSRCWRLAGLYIDDLTTDQYTFEEIEQWLEWDRYNLRHNHATVTAVCERPGQSDFHVDISHHFADPCNDSGRPPSFETLATRLQDYVDMRRQYAATSN